MNPQPDEVELKEYEEFQATAAQIVGEVGLADRILEYYLPTKDLINTFINDYIIVQHPDKVYTRVTLLGEFLIWKRGLASKP